jgi:ABC-type multidrug transport system ATPase subunit
LKNSEAGGVAARRVWHRYPGTGWVLRGADADIREKEIVAIVGPNGSGKTTLLKLLAGLAEPTRGEILYWGRSLWSLPPRERLQARRLVVYVHENPAMLRGTVLDNIAAGPRLRGASQAEAEQAAREAAERLGLTSLLGEKARSLSRGQQQLVAIARALAVRPRLLLLDEPFAHLDRVKRRLLADLVEELAGEGKGVAIASHNQYIVSRLASRILQVEEGRAEEVTAEELA